MTDTVDQVIYKAGDAYHTYHIDRLKDTKYAAVYLEVHLENHRLLDIETNLLKLVLSDVAEAIYGLADWLKGLGLKLTVTVDKEAEVQDFLKRLPRWKFVK